MGDLLMPGWPPLSVGWNRVRENLLRKEREAEASERDAARHELDGDEAEAAATRHAEERRARREAEASSSDHAGSDRSRATR
jgi:hypothetical protein